jgi:type III restriction enzyme
MSNKFFEEPILNSPYEYPARHWELVDGQPTQKIIESRRWAEFITPIPKPRKRRTKPSSQDEMVFDEGKGISSKRQQYDATSIINEVRSHVDAWRRLPPSQWNVTPVTQRLLLHWRNHNFANQRPFFCQVEAAETAIWLTEVASLTKAGQSILENLKSANEQANPGLNRLALKLATGAGKTTVMAMLLAWQTVNAVRYPGSKNFTRGFLIVSPGLTIKDRLRVLQPTDPENYFKTREIVPADMLDDIRRAKIVITNYHAFKLRERMEISKGTRELLQGRNGPEIKTKENEGEMIRRVMEELMSLKGVMVINDEAHHCYRAKPIDDDEFTDEKGNKLTGDELKEAKAQAKKDKEAARLWITGLETVQRKLGVTRIVDLSATPFFLAGSGYVEGTMFPWTMSDFSLMDAIECGIVKLPRVPVAQNLAGAKDDEMPMYRELWKHIRKKMPKKGRSSDDQLDPDKLPTLLKTALEALYGHYEKTFQLWKDAGIRVPPCFIVVCNNCSTSKLVYDYISGYERTNADGSVTVHNGRLPLFRNYDDYDAPLARPKTLLIDSEQLDSGEALSDDFRKAAAQEIERFRREKVERTGDVRAGENFSEQELLREVMNTVGKLSTLGEEIRCVVSVSMLTEGWDANTVTHVLGVRAFGTQLLCEQVVGRALRRQSYHINDKGLFDVEYSDVLGIPFDFTAKPVIAPPKPPPDTVQVKAVRPERDHLEIRFPRVEGYRVELPEEVVTADFTEDSILTLTPELTGPTAVEAAGIIGESVNLTVAHLADLRPATLLFRLTQRLLTTKFRDPGQDPKLHLFGPLRRITREWLDKYLECKGGTYPAQLLYPELADMACERISQAITRTYLQTQPIKALIDPFNPEGSTKHVKFNTSAPLRYETSADRCHINWVVMDNDWEAEFCRVAESHPQVRAYVKNHGLGFEVPYRYGSETRRYIPDFIVLIDDGHGPEDLLRLIVEIKGYRGEDAKIKASTMHTYWVPGVNNLGTFGRWAFVELCDFYEMDASFADKIKAFFDSMVQNASQNSHS